MSALPAENLEPFELTNVHRFPGAEPMNPVTAEPQAYEPVPDVLLPGEVKPKGKPGRPKFSKNKAPAKRAKKPAPPVEPVTESPAKPLPIATVPAGGALPNVQFSRSRVDTLLMILGCAGLIALGFGVGWLMLGGVR